MTIQEQVPETVRTTAKDHGNSFHCQVVRAFRRHGWHTTVTPYYLDSESDKAREIDLVAENRWEKPINGPHGRPEWQHVKLFVECKYFDRETLVWFDERDNDAATKWITTNTRLVKPENRYTKMHHYLLGDGMVAKLFARSRAERKDTSIEPIYGALNQVLHAMVSLRRQGTSFSEHSGTDLFVAEFPVIICSSLDNLWRIDIADDEGLIRPVKSRFQLEVEYAYRDLGKEHRREYFLVDVVPLSELEQYFKALDADVNATRECWSAH